MNKEQKQQLKAIGVLLCVLAVLWALIFGAIGYACQKVSEDETVKAIGDKIDREIIEWTEAP